MMSFFSSGESWRSEKRGMLCGPDSMAAYIWSSVAPSRSGARLPDESAPPRPVKLWQGVQLRRESSPPRPGGGPPRLLARLRRPRGAAAVGSDVRGHRVDLLRREHRRLLLGLGALHHSGHAAGRGLEVARRLADAHQARPAALDPLEVRAVAADAGVVEDLLALAHHRRVLL